MVSLEDSLSTTLCKVSRWRSLIHESNNCLPSARGVTVIALDTTGIMGEGHRFCLHRSDGTRTDKHHLWGVHTVDVGFGARRSQKRAIESLQPPYPHFTDETIDAERGKQLPKAAGWDVVESEPPLVWPWSLGPPLCYLWYLCLRRSCYHSRQVRVLWYRPGRVGVLVDLTGQLRNNFLLLLMTLMHVYPNPLLSSCTRKYLSELASIRRNNEQICKMLFTECQINF